MAEPVCSNCGLPIHSQGVGICQCQTPLPRIVRLTRMMALRGFSCRFHEFIESIRHTEFGRLLVSEMKMRPMEGD